MSILPFISNVEAIPLPANGEKADQETAAWIERAKGNTDSSIQFIADALSDPGGSALLRAIFGNSPFLTQALQQEPDVLMLAALHGPDEALVRVLAPLHDKSVFARGHEDISRELRRTRRRIALLVALADLSGAWSLARVTGALSDLAEIAVDAALGHLLHQAHLQGKCALPDVERPTQDCGIAILGMGKLGARELNYSSDIDLIVLFDADKVDWRDDAGPQQGLHRLIRDLVNLLSARTRDGYVLRTDLRLRPDAGATPLAVSTTAAERYYESLGQNWERAAMIKARPIAGDISTGNEMLERLRPFIWRKHLDFAAIQDIHSIKRQINAHKGHHEIAVSGHNIKIGRGGIREIEFFAQTQQLIWGGRDPSLRGSETCTALRALVDAGRTGTNVANDLNKAYVFLRQLEHRLQMIADEQTHTLPSTDEGLAHIAVFAGFPTIDAFTEAVTSQLEMVEQHYGRLFEDAPELGGQTGNLVFTGPENDPDTVGTLSGLGFSDGDALSATIRGWHHGRVRATRSTRARELLTELLPSLLDALAKTVDPDAAFFHFDGFMKNLPSGVQLFSLFHANPGLLNLVAEVMGSAPHLAKQLSRRPDLLDGVLTGDFYAPLPPITELEQDLTTLLDAAPDFQDVLDITRRWAHDRQFQVGMQLLRGIITGNEAGPALSDIAEVVVRGLLPPVQAEFAEQHGTIEGGALAVLAMGNLGGRELTFLSDLDVIFLYQSSAGLDATSNGAKPLQASQYFGRLSQRLTSALTALTAEGRLYEIDTRLRPSGQAGPIASEISGFIDYQRTQAWPWEHMALTRARVLAGSPSLKRDVEAALKSILVVPRNPEKLARDVADMRARIDTERHTDNPWKLKHSRGGLLDIEFIVQYLQLAHAHVHPGILSPSTTTALARSVEAGVLPEQVGQELISATRFFRSLQALLRLTVGMTRDPDRYPEGLRDRLITQGDGLDSFAELEDRLFGLQDKVRTTHYAAIVEHPARQTDDAE